MKGYRASSARQIKTTVRAVIATTDQSTKLNSKINGSAVASESGWQSRTDASAMIFAGMALTTGDHPPDHPISRLTND